MTLFNINWYMYIVIFTIKKPKRNDFVHFICIILFVLNNITDPRVPYFPREILRASTEVSSHIRMYVWCKIV